MEEAIAAAAIAAAVRRTLNRPEGEGPSVGLDKEMEAVLAMLPANINSPEEFAKFMKVLTNVRVKKLKLGIYSKKVITYKEK